MRQHIQFVLLHSVFVVFLADLIAALPVESANPNIGSMTETGRMELEEEAIIYPELKEEDIVSQELYREDDSFRELYKDGSVSRQVYDSDSLSPDELLTKPTKLYNSNSLSPDELLTEPNELYDSNSLYTELLTEPNELYNATTEGDRDVIRSYRSNCYVRTAPKYRYPTTNSLESLHDEDNIKTQIDDPLPLEIVLRGKESNTTKKNRKQKMKSIMQYKRLLKNIAKLLREVRHEISSE